ncbi:hypothetical protein ACFQ80_05925 [Isoptericola sp. NPDC056578]|uniref:hypothetical protein n=1 Tax=Isoptericola sp. NPDC056578 TaxID=3345870 RepID=UPI0036C1FB2F
MSARKRLAAILAMTAVVALTTAASASAAVSGQQTAAVPDPILVTDSHGIPASDFRLAMYDGGQVWNADNWFWTMAMTIGWEPYRYFMQISIGTLAWLMKLEWVEWLLAPLRGLASVVQIAVDQFGLMQLMFVILSAVVAWWLIKGRFAGGIVELLVGCTIAALAVGVLANPIGIIGDKDTGLIYQSRDAGMDLSAAISSDGKNLEGNSAELADSAVTALVDTFIRTPHQIINYGAVIDDSKCESVYDDAVQNGKDLTDTRETIARCDPAYKEFSDKPDIVKTINAGEMWTVLIAFGLFSLVLMIVFILAVLGAGWQGIKLIALLIIGVAPGGPRASLMRTASNLAFALGMIAITCAFITGWMKIQTVFFAQSEGVPFMLRIRIFNLLLVAGTIGLIIARHKVKKALHRIGDRLAQLGASSTAYEPSKLPGQVADKGYQAWLFARRGAKKLPPANTAKPQLEAPASGSSPAVRVPVKTRPQLATSSVPNLLGPGAGTSPTPGPGPAPRPPWAPKGPFHQPATTAAGALTSAPSKALILRSRLGTATKAAAQGAALFATGGSSAAVTAGAKVLAIGTKTGTAARTATAATTTTRAITASKSAVTAGAAAKGAKVISTGKAANAVTRTTKAVDAARQARDSALRAKLTSSPMRPHKGGGMVDQSTGVTYRRDTTPNGNDDVEVYRPTGIDPDAVRELRARLKPTNFGKHS